MYRENYVNALRAELVELVAKDLTPVAIHYGYSEVPLEANIKWRPQVLLIGNYSSGKSTMINEFLGANIQATGQAPTDDSFTIITYGEPKSENEPIHVTEERDGKYLLNDPEYPFETLKKYGQRFAAHFRLKKVNSPFLKSLALIDTPGMLDSITERDRGYNYQEVIGDLAQIADLVLVVFDPHKAGTVREAYISIRETLPAKTFEDRLLFVLNRIDECSSLTDLLRVYGTLCWNLSQITGRKDIPMIHMTYSPRATSVPDDEFQGEMRYLSYLENQRGDLRKAILQAPRRRLDHLATFVETHGERLSHFLEAIVSYRKGLRTFRFKQGLFGLVAGIICGGAACLGLYKYGLIGLDHRLLAGVGGTVALAVLLLWMSFPRKMAEARFHRQCLDGLDGLTPLDTQTRRDSWEAVRKLTYDYLTKTAGRFSLRGAKKDLTVVHRAWDKGSRDVREALNELAKLSHDEQPTTGNPSST
jgi:EH domain-containing protein 1